MHLKGKIELLKFLQENFPKRLKKNKSRLGNREYVVKSKLFDDFHFTGEFTDIEFSNCKFRNCTFENIWAFFFILKKCKFTDCSFKNSRFSHLDFAWDDVEFEKCNFRLIQFDEGGLYNVFFSNSNFYGFSLLGFVPFENVWFDTCNLENSQFQSLIYHKDKDEIDIEFKDLIIDNCRIDFSYFNSVDLRNSLITNSDFYKTAFVDCLFGLHTISDSEESKVQNYASIDFQSIIKSDSLDSHVLKKYFNVTDPNIKKTINKITSEIDFKTVFISYSFKDKEFANILNRELQKRGVRTFIWEKDAPGGKLLDDIMTSNIQKHEKILFIASQNSLKSTACHFELSEGRKKQEATWESIFFPIHIDNYLFEVNKNQIRPINKSDEYWENIQEIKRINSLDFSDFKNCKGDVEKFIEAVNGIVEELKK